MTDPELDVLAAAIGITLEPGWRDGVRMNVEVSLRMATMVAAFPLGDEADALPIYTP
jgi:hypothetical protein